MKRTLWWVNFDRALDDDGYPIDEERVLIKANSKYEPNAVSSLLDNGMHAPALDIDMPCRLVPSRTPGHHHLYIDHPMTWRAYKKLMKALWKAGIVEKGYYKASKRKGASFLRLPDISSARWE